MTFTPRRFFLVAVAGWMNPQQQDVERLGGLGVLIRRRRSRA